jgi:toxin-antitoxin system PIN domain toxin
MKHLCDVNFWIALIVEEHPKHAFAKRWFDQLSEADSAFFCRPTQQGFLRLVSDEAIFKTSALTNDKAVAAYQWLRKDPRIGWLDEPAGLEAKWFFYAGVRTKSPKVWMDAYLAAFAILSEARLITFDRGFRVYRSLDWFDPSRGK